MTSEELQALTEIAAALSDRDLAALSRIATERDALALRTSELRQSGTGQEGDALEPAARVGAGLLWQRWRERELLRLEAQRADVAVREAAARAAAQKSFGRKTALEELALTISDGTCRS